MIFITDMQLYIFFLLSSTSHITPLTPLNKHSYDDIKQGQFIIDGGGRKKRSSFQIYKSPPKQADQNLQAGSSLLGLSK